MLYLTRNTLYSPSKQIATLKSQLEKLQLTYVSETGESNIELYKHSFHLRYILLSVENLKKQIVEAHRAIAEIAASSCTGTDTAGDYLEARIKFLQHQVNDSIRNYACLLFPLILII